MIPNATTYQHAAADDTGTEDEFIGAELQNLIRIQGSQEIPVTNVEIRGLTLRHTAADFLERYEVPGGGDQVGLLVSAT